MIIVNNKIADVFYLTTKEDHEKVFEDLAKKIGIHKNLSYPLRIHTKVVYSPMELMDFVTSIAANNNYSKWIHLIFDYVSFFPVYPEEYRTVVRTLIILYPEYQFFFDETATEEIQNGNPIYPLFLGIPNSCLDEEVHVFSLKKELRVSRIMCYDNLFDASNLRFCIKQHKYDELNIGKKNFDNIQKSRSTNLAICVEEERSQNLYNSFAAYACGYRSIPVTTATLLKQLNDKKWDKNKDNNSYIILRDYDLQFADEPQGDSEAIHYIRGWKFDGFNEIKNRLFPSTGTCLLCDQNDYWKNFISSKIPVFYISKGEDFIEISLSKETDTNISEKIKNYQKIHFRGIPKPISGLYSSFLNIPEVREVFKKSRDTNKIDVKRTTGGHGVPLDIYNWVKDMIYRAETYYAANRYIHSAVLCQESMEVMNGFHTALMLKAYSIKAKAENAIAINILGGSEKELCKDACVRIEMIKKDVARLLSSNKEQSINVLSQIFSDCRNYCKEKEHFAVEDCFLSAMAEINEGVSFKRSDRRNNKDDKKINNLKETFNNIIKKHKVFFAEKIHNFIDKVNSYGD